MSWGIVATQILLILLLVVSVQASTCAGFNCSEVPDEPDMSLILGLALGIGALIFTGTMVFIYWRRRRLRHLRRDNVASVEDQTMARPQPYHSSDLSASSEDYGKYAQTPDKWQPVVTVPKPTVTRPER